PLPPLEREYSLEQQQSSQLEQIHTLVDRQQEQIARLNGQIEQMQLLIEQQQQSLTMMNDRERFIEAIADEQLKAPFGQANDFRTAMLWAVGGIVLVMTVGGGIVLVGIIALLLDPNRRAARMSQIAPPHAVPSLSFLSPTDGVFASRGGSLYQAFSVIAREK
ncbi:MAG: hypothetical protein HC925_04225, partial [Coleofasciculaceae cyanobacterium SM2_3_26]|nr:hypothetical protein [Coleofasciculaceae cyanobacterium SM2_3_26]